MLKNYRYLTDDDYVKDAIPAKFSREHWGKWMKLDWMGLLDRFLEEYNTYYGGAFENVPVQKIEVNMPSSSGKSHKSHFKTKYDFYNCHSWQDIISTYWDYGYLFNWYEPFSAAPKDELTSVESINDNKCRVFYVAGVYNDYIGAKLGKEFNYALKTQQWNSMGEKWQYGGYKKLASEILKVLEEHPDWWIEESDCRKYDLTAVFFFFLLCYCMRTKYSFTTDPQYTRRLKWLYRQFLRKYLIWFDGKVVETTRGNPSGCKYTSEDNSIRHIFIRWFHFVIRHKMAPDTFWRELFLRLMSDDSICVGPREMLSEESLNESYTTWNTVYKGHVKPLARDITNTTYLGATFRRHPDGSITYTVSVDKVFASACDLKGLSYRERVNKLESLASLLADDKDILQSFLEFIHPYVINVSRVMYIATGLSQHDGVFPTGLPTADTF